MSGLGRPADKRLRLCRCPKGAAASRKGSGINASGDAEAKQSAVQTSGRERDNISLWSVDWAKSFCATSGLGLKFMSSPLEHCLHLPGILLCDDMALELEGHGQFLADLERLPQKLDRGDALERLETCLT